MIKINLNAEKKAKIEGLFLQDLIGTPTRKPGKLIVALSESNSRILVKNYSGALYDFLYEEETDNPNIENVKALLLADRQQMESFISQFAPVNSDFARDLLDNVFCYQNFSHRKVVLEILRKMEMPVCPYCNRLYITVVKSGTVRAQLDHFFPKTLYPYLALSLYNLIPSCSVCNQAKSELDTRISPLLYPYKDEFGEEIVFTLDMMNQNDFVQKIRGDSSHIRVRINNSCASSDLWEAASQQDKRLHLTALYNEHGKYIADILKNYYINTEARIAELRQCFPEIFPTRDTVRSLMFMSCLEKERWGERPLAKLTHDICCELDNLSG